MYTPGRLYTPPHGGGVGGNCPPYEGLGGVNPPLAGGFEGQQSPSEGSGSMRLKLKIDVKFPCKNIVISNQSGSFIRRMI